MRFRRVKKAMPERGGIKNENIIEIMFKPRLSTSCRRHWRHTYNSRGNIDPVS